MPKGGEGARGFRDPVSRSRLCISVSTDDPCPALSVAAPSPDGAPTLSEAGTDGLWTPGETVEVTVAFTEPVTVGTAVGVPSIGLRLGGSELRSAAYLRGSGTSALVFAYTLTEADGSHSSMLVPPNSLALNGGTIRSREHREDASLIHDAAVIGPPPQQGQQQQTSNTEATGGPGIDGSPVVGQTLTATTSGIADEDGMTGAVFTYRWIRQNLATALAEEIDGATSSTYTVTSEDEGHVLMVLVTFTDDAGNEESLSSAATAAVTQSLTASVHNTPASHDGSATFTFELRLSETPKEDFSYATLRDHAFTVTGGTVTNARRLEPGKNVRWEIAVQPSGNADVILSLPVTTDCEAQGAVCTGDGRMLSQRVELTVSGPSR